MGNINYHVDLDTLSRVIDAIPSNIFLKDTELRYVFSSHIWEQIETGTDEEFDIYGKTDRDIRKDAANLENQEKSDRAILETGVGRQYTIKADSDGSIQYLDISKEPVRDKDGNVIGIVGLINDVTHVTYELEKALKEAERAAQMKSDFLANMSHEIRTPMNAVIGMAEMALREDISPAARDYISQIKTSGKALLNIINDILDYSKIESGKMDIITEDYEPLSVMHDLSSIITTRIGDKHIELIGTINPNTPRGLTGDILRIRQIIINIANNAVKFTNHGFVWVDINFEKKSDDEALIIIEVHDTGIGIKEEDIEKLFNSFQQVDSKRNRNVEGTGLGLAISKNLLSLMNGDISVKSKYGEGSVFRIEIPQTVSDWTPVIIIDNPDKKVVFGYWDGVDGSDMFYESLNQFKVKSINLNNLDDYEKITASNADYFKDKEIFLFTDLENYEKKVKEFAVKHPEVQFVVNCDFFTKLGERSENVRYLNKPFSNLGISSVLNNKKDVIKSESSYEFEFIAPDAKVLIVDDNEINLVVAEGLLEPLKMQITTVTSGKKALEAIEREKFDIVFMDHMMPELDGVETTRIIRRLHPELDNMPVIALTANAVGEARKMFLEEGMNDFVAKPIEVRTITGKIAQWLPKEKVKKAGDIDIADYEAMASKSVENGNESTQAASEDGPLVIGDLDIDSAISLIGNEKLYMTILEKYYGVIESKAKFIKECEKEENIKSYTIEVHALKSSSKQIGAMELSAMAAELEKCGNEGDISTIHAKTDEMLYKYYGYLEVLRPLFEKEDNGEVDIKSAIDRNLLNEFFDKMLQAADDLDMDGMEETAAEMDKYKYEGPENDYFNALKEAVSNIDVDTIAEIINKWRA